MDNQLFQDHYVHAYNTIVIGEAEKLYDKIVKGLVVEIMGELLQQWTFFNSLSCQK
jgi:hypothetical protein